MPAYTFFEHTADTGIRAEGRTLSEVAVGLAEGLRELLVEDSRIELKEARPLALTAADAASLMLVWLQELLYWFSSEGFVPAAFALDEVTPTSLRGTVRGEWFDPARHQQGREVKAITRHHLRVEPRGSGWQGEVIVDI